MVAPRKLGRGPSGVISVVAPDGFGCPGLRVTACVKVATKTWQGIPSRTTTEENFMKAVCGGTYPYET